LALRVAPATEQDREQAEELARSVREVTNEEAGLAYVGWGCAGEEPAEAARASGIRLGVAKHPQAKKDSVLLSRRWVVERSFARTARFRRLVKDYERLPATAAGPHLVAFFVFLRLPPRLAVLGSSPYGL
jgi:transposase